MSGPVEIGGVPCRWAEGDRAAVLLPDQNEAGAADPDAPGLRALEAALIAEGLGVLTVDAGPSWWATRGPTPAWFAESLRPWLGERTSGLVGVGVGGQGALRVAYGRGDRWACAAAVAPACDLGRWHGRGSGLDDEFATADDARQAEAPLFYNPLSSTRAQLIWCDPRDEACAPSAMRAVSKVASSGGPVDADLETEAGDGRDAYVAARAGELAAWAAAALKRAAERPPLRVL